MPAKTRKAGIPLAFGLIIAAIFVTCWPAESKLSPTPPPQPTVPRRDKDTFMYRGGVALEAAGLSNFPWSPEELPGLIVPHGAGKATAADGVVVPRQAIFTMMHTNATDATGVPAGIPRFAKSLRRSGSDALLVVMCREATRPMIAELFAPYGPFIALGYADRAEYQIKKFWVSSLRFLIARLFLEVHVDRFDYVMTSDILDVVFQEDPFAFLATELKRTGKRMVVAAELAVMGDPNELDLGLNLDWSLHCGAAKNEVVGHKVLCSGTTLGESTIMLRYFTEMDMRMRRRQCHTLAMDQGAHNALLYSKAYYRDAMVIHDSMAGRLLTMHGVPRLGFDRDGRVMNQRGERYMLTHQVNRCKDHVKAFQLVTTAAGGTPVFEESNFTCEHVLEPPYFS